MRIERGRLAYGWNGAVRVRSRRFPQRKRRQFLSRVTGAAAATIAASQLGALAPPSLHITASRSGSTIFLHVANMSYSGAVEVSFAVEGVVATGGRVLEISPVNPRQEINPVNPEVFRPREQALPAGDSPKWRFPARSVSAVELGCRIA